MPGIRFKFTASYPFLMKGLGAKYLRVTKRLRTRVLTFFARYMRKTIVSQFKDAGHGGTHRGVDWNQNSATKDPPARRFPSNSDHFAPQYRRLKDGVLVPAWGGVPKLNGKGMVKGRLRHGGGRVTQRSNVMQDKDGKLLSAAARTFEITGEAEKVKISTEGEGYFRMQHAMRSFMFYTPEDLTAFRVLTLERFKEFREMMAKDGE